jgi:hypothetical protein
MEGRKKVDWRKRRRLKGRRDEKEEGRIGKIREEKEEEGRGMVEEGWRTKR